MRDASTQMVYDLARRDHRVMALTADNRNEIYDCIRQELPEQYVDYGIAEENMVASAAGLASCGKIPFLYTITDFLSLHALEFIRNDVCVPKQHVIFLGRSSGLTSYTMGPTHQGTEELAILRTLPNLLVISPATPIEAREATRFSYEYDGPVYIRLEGRGETEYFGEDFRFLPGEGHVLHAGDDVTVVAMGSIVNEALEVATAFETEGVGMRVIEMSTVQPIDAAMMLDSARQTKGIISLEEHSKHGGLGGAIAECLTEQGCGARLIRLGLNGCAAGCGKRQYMREQNGIGKNALRDAVRSLMADGGRE